LDAESGSVVCDAERKNIWTCVKQCSVNTLPMSTNTVRPSGNFRPRSDDHGSVSAGCGNGAAYAAWVVCVSVRNVDVVLLNIGIQVRLMLA